MMLAGHGGSVESEATRLNESQTHEIRVELGRLRESSAFRTSKRCREFLEYIVEHTLHGPTGTLKERSIGVELFQLPQDFDTGQHTIVRVTANEVRKKLAQHYLAENGSYHPVKINVPAGSYSAEFRWEDPPPAPVPAADPASVVTPVPARQWRINGPTIAFGTVAILIAVGLAVWRMDAAKTVTVDAKSPAEAMAGGGGALPVGGELRMICAIVRRKSLHPLENCFFTLALISRNRLSLIPSSREIRDASAVCPRTREASRADAAPPV